MKSTSKPDMNREIAVVPVDDTPTKKARGRPNHLCGLAESLSESHVSYQRQRHEEKIKARPTVRVWNDFTFRYGSIADEYSSL
jgi:hypothetical protein